MICFFIGINFYTQIWNMSLKTSDVMWVSQSQMDMTALDANPEIKVETTRHIFTPPSPVDSFIENIINAINVNIYAMSVK